MSKTRIAGPVVDLALDEARQDFSGEVPPLGYTWRGDGFEAILCRANGVVVEGALVQVTDQNHDCVEVTSAVIAALSAAQVTAALLGFAQALCADNDLVWVVTKKSNGLDTDIVALAGGAIAANAKVNSTTTDGEIDDDAAATQWTIEGIEIGTDPASGIVFSTWSAPTGLVINPTVLI